MIFSQEFSFIPNYFPQKYSENLIFQINYVNAHATSTPAGDSVEADAIRNRFSANQQRPIAVSSIKGHIGHLLGAAGSVETIATIGCIRDRKLPANLNLEQSDVRISILI